MMLCRRCFQERFARNVYKRSLAELGLKGSEESSSAVVLLCLFMPLVALFIFRVVVATARIALPRSEISEILHW